ncbi:MAG: SDR family oxidoreductase [Spirochaetales bacterium]|nr:SDR family oxidoreductase [Spirochaetales bacterium]
MFHKGTDKKKKTFFLTGATGFLGGFLCAELLQRGYRVIVLIRPSGRKSAFKRFESLLRFHNLANSTALQYRVVEGWLDQPCFGLTGNHYHSLARETDQIIHCAADTSFSERKREGVFKTNVFSLNRILEYARIAQVDFFHHISTAYSAGCHNGRVPEKLHAPGRFNNVYEESKCRGEHIVTDFCGHYHIPLNIFRPSIVYGHSRTGKCLRFNALYFPIKALCFLGNMYEADIAEHGGTRAGEIGVKKESDGTLFLPLRIIGRETGRINIIPIDFFADAVATIILDADKGGIFHIVDSRSRTLRELVSFVRKYFHFSGIEVVDIDNKTKVERNALEVLFDNYIRIYGPYMQDERIFDHTNTSEILSGYGIQCRRFSYEVFETIIAYAVGMDWGKDIDV